VVDVILDELRSGATDARLAASIWEQAVTLRVRRVEPVWTARGKLLPLHSPRMAQF
jgi:hypothetical protein